MRRVLAVAGASLLIAIAILVRNAIDDDSEETAVDTEDEPVGDLVVACVPELRDACEALDADVRVEAPADTIAGAADVDAWITFDPWPAIAEADAGRAVFAGESIAVASTDLVLVSRTTSLPASCDPPDWACVVDVPTSAAPTLPSAGRGLAPLVHGFAALGWSAVERPGEPFARNDFELPEFQAWHQALRFSRDPLNDMIAFSPAGPVATGTTRAAFESEVLGQREDGRLEATATSAAATVAVVVVGPEAERVAGSDGLLDGLADLGYDPEPDPDAVTTGLPNPGVLFALQELS